MWRESNFQDAVSAAVILRLLGMVRSIRFISHTGEISALARQPPNTMFVFDANTVLNFMRHADHSTRLDDAHFRLLRETRQRIHIQWTQRSRYLPVEPVLALMELTRQDCEADFETYLVKFEHFFRSVYGVENLDPTWIQQTYEPVSQLLSSIHRSLLLTLKQIYAAMPASGSVQHRIVLERIDGFLNWVITERHNLAVIGGPLVYLAVYSIAGSPEAHRFLKLGKMAKEGSDAIARNVAWDMMHWVNLDFHYHYAKYPSTVVCTSDQSLADFLLMRKNLGPRIGRERMLNARVVNSYGDLNLPKLSRLDDTSLSVKVSKRLLMFWQRLGEYSDDEILFAPLGI